MVNTLKIGTFLAKFTQPSEAQVEPKIKMLFLEAFEMNSKKKAVQVEKKEEGTLKGKRRPNSINMGEKTLSVREGV